MHVFKIGNGAETDSLLLQDCSYQKVPFPPGRVADIILIIPVGSSGGHHAHWRAGNGPQSTKWPNRAGTVAIQWCHCLWSSLLISFSSAPASSILWLREDRLLLEKKNMVPSVAEEKRL